MILRMEMKSHKLKYKRYIKNKIEVNIGVIQEQLKTKLRSRMRVV